jgi:lambda repressor-like predicted transcriptional regulator
MPKVIEGSRYKKKYNQEAISKALEDILNNGVSKKAASKKYGIPRSTLQFRLSQKFTKTTFGPSPILSKEEEQILVDWVLQSHRTGFREERKTCKSASNHF